MLKDDQLIGTKKKRRDHHRGDTGRQKGKAKEMLKDDQLLGTKKKGDTITGETKREGQGNATR